MAISDNEERVSSEKESDPEVLSETTDIDSEDIDGSNQKKAPTSKRKRNDSKVNKSSSSPAKKPTKQPTKKSRANTLSVQNVVQAPTETIPPGRVGKSTMEFLAKLATKECNDRECHNFPPNKPVIYYDRNLDPVYRHAYKNWTEFIDYMIPLTIEKADENLPHLPARDLVYRLARDIRFSNDKTPYKTYFAASFSRSGRKTHFAQYFFQISPGNSLMAVGKWEPDKDQMLAFRRHIIQSPTNFRAILSAPDFLNTFGPPRPAKEGESSKNHSIFDAHDTLKSSPKMAGVTREHPDIDLLRLRSIYAVHHFSDEEVLSDSFVDSIISVMQAGEPLVNGLNDIYYPPLE